MEPGLTMPSQKTSKDFNYDASLSTRGGKYFLHIKELHIIAQGDSLAEAHEKLLIKKKAFLKEIEEAGELDSLPEPVTPPTSAQKLFKQEIALFLSKSLVAGFVALLILTFAINKIDHVLTLKSETITASAKILTKKILWYLEAEIYNFSNRDISPERIQKFKKSLSLVIKKLQPITEELGFVIVSKPNTEETPPIKSKPQNSLVSKEGH